MNWRDCPYFPTTKIRTRGSQLFFVNPNVTNEGRVPPVPGSIANYPYKLPFLSRSYPVRSIHVFDPGSLGTSTGNPVMALITLRRSDGTYLLKDVPLATFADQTIVFGSNYQRPLLFRSDFYPDPKLSYVTWMVAGQTGEIGIQFNYG